LRDDGTEDFVTATYAPGGTQLWMRTFDVPEKKNCQAKALALDGRDNVYIAGDVFNWEEDGSWEYATVKYDAEGTLLWARTFKDPEGFSESARVLVVDGAGSVYVTGSTTGNDGVVRILTVKYVQDAEGGPRVPGDCNQDGAVDMSDAVCILLALFAGDGSGFPCGSGSPDEDGNKALLDWQPDGRVDISDAISLLLFLFGGGQPHPLDRSDAGPPCVPITGCRGSTACE
jgi:hypothetical protein